MKDNLKHIRSHNQLNENPFYILHLKLNSRHHKNNSPQLILTGNFKLYVIIKHRFEVKISRLSAAGPCHARGGASNSSIFKPPKKQNKKSFGTSSYSILLCLGRLFDNRCRFFRVTFLCVPDIKNFMPHCSAHWVIIMLVCYFLRVSERLISIFAECGSVLFVICE